MQQANTESQPANSTKQTMQSTMQASKQASKPTCYAPTNQTNQINNS